ncbi:MAG TPA: hypothetical protein VGF76_16095, partial [Polyangiaceae bacterium]
MSTSALSSNVPSEPTAEEPASGQIPAAPESSEAPTERTPTKSRRPWSVRPRTIDPARREKIVAGRPAVLCVDDISVSFDGFKA